jgi:hypothetical protein
MFILGNVDIVLGLGIVGRRIQLSFWPNPNEAVWVEADVVLGVTVTTVVGVAGAVGVADAVGAAGILVGIGAGAGMLVGIVGIDVMTGDGFIGGDIQLIDRRARPSSGSTQIDAFLRDRRPVARRLLCCSRGFIVLSS